MMAGEQPDHMSIIAEVARIGEQVRGVVKQLDAQDAVLEKLKTAHNIRIGKGLIGKLIFTAIPGGLGAFVVKAFEWWGSNGHNIPPPMTPGSH